MRRLFSCYAVLLGFASIAWPAPLRQTNGCPASSGLSEKEWVCFTLDEESDRQRKEAAHDAELGALRLARPRFAHLWATVGAEYLPNATTGPWQPYGIGGVTLGRRLDLWGGFFGSDAALGVGVRF